MNNLIEKLKKNKTAFGLLPPEEQECFREVKLENCEIYMALQLWVKASKDGFNYTLTYRIKPDYQPEAEYVDPEVVEHDGWLGIWRQQREEEIQVPHTFTHLHCLPSLPNFKGFWYDYDEEMGRRYFCNFAEVAPKMSEGHKVYARLKKGE